MHIHDHKLKPEYRQAVMRVQHYINLNLNGDVSLETLAGIANYSPFHFQKIFSEAVLESPKQYVIRLRLEKAAHFIKMFPDLPIGEIASGCGFSSDSIFSRAFKNFYGISAEKFRNLPDDKIEGLKAKFNPSPEEEEASWMTPITNIQEKINTAELISTPEISSMYHSEIACLQTTLSHRENISFAFKSLIQWATPQNLITSSTKYFGIWLDIPYLTPPGKCRYLCGIESAVDFKPTRGIVVMEFNKGLYINARITGDINETLTSLIALNHRHIDSLGYSIAEMICYEQFEECPENKSYDKINRTLLIPIRSK